MSTDVEESTTGKLTEIRSFLMEIICVCLAGMLAGQIVVFAFIADIRELTYVSTSGDWMLAIGLLILALAVPTVVLYTEYQAA